jgi:hypothetical protein
MDALAGRRWLLLIQQLPTHPSSARIRLWRRLQQIGSVALKNSVYVLPHTARAREDFEWLAGEIRAARGQASVLAVEALTEAQDQEICEAFRSASRAGYDALRTKANAVLRRATARSSGQARAGLEREVRACREELARIVSLDFCGAPSRTAAEEIVNALNTKIARLTAVESPSGARVRLPALKRELYQGRTWVTRTRPGVDRMSSAWLIRTFVDSRARFAFTGDASRTAKSHVPFDMFGVELGHQGNRCTFETLCERFGIADEAVRRIGEIVHDVDLQDNRFAPAEAPVVANLIEGLRASYTDDGELLEHGIGLFAALHAAFSQTAAPARRRSKRRPSAG